MSRIVVDEWWANGGRIAESFEVFSVSRGEKTRKKANKFF